MELAHFELKNELLQFTIKRRIRVIPEESMEIINKISDKPNMYKVVNTGKELIFNPVVGQGIYVAKKSYNKLVFEKY